MGWLTRTSAAAVVAAVALLGAGPAAAQPPVAVEVSGGVYEVLGEHDVAEAGLELLGGPLPLPGLPRFFPEPAPIGGFMTNDDGSVYAYAGFRLDFPVTRRFTVTPNWAVGYYNQGEGRDLGGPVEFRSALDLAFRVSRHAAVGLSFYHLSNAGLYDLNPGSESLVVTWSWAGGDSR
ncbi:MAG TPA: acyloxyacyl hydrolase [Thermoanaerobaculia bacterium]|nr:acyloxyacyl hydrolase [Thermoanaerobaculia bacterium]